MDLRIFTEPQQGADYETLLAVARTAEDSGYDAFFRSDHYLAMGASDGLPGPTDAWVTLAALGRETSRIRLGTLVSPVTFRHPGVLALTVAQADRMSGGRVELGLGTGWYAEEHAAYAIPFPARRFGLFEEQLEIVTGLWSTPEGQRYDFAGEHYTVKDSPGLPKPAQEPHPPIIIGGSGKRRTPALAAKYAAEYNVAGGSPDDCRAAFGRVREACAAAGRDVDGLRLSVWLTTACGRDDAEARRRADTIGRSADDLRTGGLFGTPAELVDRLGTYAELGASRVYVQVMDLDDLDHVELVAAEVLSQVRHL